MPEAASAADLIAEFKKAHEWAEEGALMAYESTQVAIASLVASEHTTAIFSDHKYFENKDVSAAQYKLDTVLNLKDPILPKIIWCKDATFNLVIAVRSSALLEGIALFKQVVAQYTDVSLKMIVFTGMELRLAEGTDLLREKLPFNPESISLLNRPISEKGGSHLHTWIVEAPQGVRNNPFATAPARHIVQLLPPGQDPLKLFAPIAKQVDKLANCINNKFLNEMVSELGLDTGLTAISPGPHPTQTSWVIFQQALVPQDKIDQTESKYYSKENYARVPFKTYSGDLNDCECIAEVWIVKKAQTHEALTKFWAVLNFHLCKITDQLQHRPQAQYTNTNKIRLGFKTKADAQVFVEKSLPQLKELGYAFKTEGTKDGYWDQRGSSSSAASIRTSTSWSTKGSKAPTEKEDHVVLVDIPEYLAPNEILAVVKHALASRSIPVEDTQVSIERLRWSMGNIRQPNWSVRAPGVKGLAGAVLTLTDHEGSQRVATIRSYSDWETSWQSWRERDKNKPQQAQQAGPMTPAQILRRNPNSLLPSPQVQVPPNPMQAVQVLPNILPPQVQPPHPLYQGQVPLTQQNLSYLQALVSQTPPSQSSGSRMMALDIDSVRGKRPRNGYDDNF